MRFRSPRTELEVISSFDLQKDSLYMLSLMLISESGLEYIVIGSSTRLTEILRKCCIKIHEGLHSSYAGRTATRFEAPMACGYLLSFCRSFGYIDIWLKLFAKSNVVKWFKLPSFGYRVFIFNGHIFERSKMRHFSFPSFPIFRSFPNRCIIWTRGLGYMYP